MSVTVDKKILVELREETGVSMSDCVSALKETNNDKEKAIEFLRKKGIASSSKKASREANVNGIFYAKNNKKICIVKISSETDFVISNEKFLKLGNEITKCALDNSVKTLEELFTLKASNGENMQNFFDAEKYALGENIVLRNIINIELKENEFAEVYLHNKLNDNCGRILSAVIYSNNKESSDFAKKIAMHIAASSPKYLNAQAVPSDVKEAELNIYEEKIKNSGKTGDIVKKIAEGMLNKYYEDNCLLSQAYVLEPKMKVLEAVQKHNKDNQGENFEIKLFCREE